MTDETETPNPSTVDAESEARFWRDVDALEFDLAKLKSQRTNRELQTKVAAEAVQQGPKRTYKLSELIQERFPEVDDLIYVEASSATKSDKNASTTEIWERGDRAIATGAGFAFLGGLLAQLPGAVAGAVFGALYGLFVAPKKSGHAS